MADTSRDKVDKLIDAALDAFARDGLAGARVDAIAGAAGMNKRLLYHYVGDKAALFDAAARAAVDRLLTSDPPGADARAWRVLCHASATGRCPDLTALLERLGDEPPATLGRRLVLGLLPELAPVLREGTVARGHDVPARPKPRIRLRPGHGRESRG